MTEPITKVLRRGRAIQIGVGWDCTVLEIDLPIPALPSAFDGLKIVHLSDAHFGPKWHDAYDHAIETVNAMNADLIAFTGDWVEDKFDFREGVKGALRLVAGLRSKFGTFTCLGNHDGDLIAPWLRDAGVHVLIGEGRAIVGDGATLEIVGLPGVSRDDLQDELLASFGPRAPTSLRILLAHYPDQIRRVTALAPQLMLAGHTHGGQVCLPGQVPIIKHDSLPRHQVVGLHRISDTWLNTSRGLGFSDWNIRVFCPPEITLFVLRNAD